MKLKVLISLFCCLPLGLTDKTVENSGDHYEIADKHFLGKQKRILQLFDHINQQSVYKEIIKAANSIEVEKLKEYYEKPEVVEAFLEVYESGLLPKDGIFSSYNSDHIQEVKSIFKLFYHAKDFETFYRIACWARQNLNAGLFLYVFYAALAHRNDCKQYNTPPINEILPHHFFSSDVIEKANDLKQQFHGKDVTLPKSEDGFEGYTINSYYSGYHVHLHPDQTLVNYYLEDVGINSFFYYYNMYYPYWLGSKDLEESEAFYKRGEVFFLHVQQSAARFYLERLSNNLGTIPDINWDAAFKTGYVPSLRHFNGLEFPSRPNSADLKDFYQGYRKDVMNIQDSSRRLRDALDSGKIHVEGQKEKKTVDILNEEGLDVVGNMIEGNADSPNLKFFGSVPYYARHVLGYAPQAKHKNQILASAMEHDETALRDPAYYQLYRELHSFLFKYKSSLQPYTRKEVEFPGVTIKNVEFDKLVTHFDYFYSDLSNAVHVTPEEAESQEFKVRVKQYRLNQKPFKYRVLVEADKEYQASVRVYIGPKYNEHGEIIDISQNRVNFVQFDYFPYKLSTGENIIERNSMELFEYCGDRTPYREMYQQILLAEAGKAEFKIKPDDVCFPRRVALPRGSVGGTPYQFFVIVSSYKTSDSGTTYDDVHQYPVNRMDEYPLDYPFDRRMEHDGLYNIPNAYFYETKIYFDDTTDKNNPF